MTSGFRRTMLGGAAIACLLVFVSAAIAANATAPKVDVVASYTHPDPDPGYSWVCVHVKGTHNTKLTVHVAGGHVIGLRTKTAKITSSRGVIVRFKITAPAGYNFTVTGKLGSGTTTKRAPVNVPQPGDGTPSGSFRCI